MTGQLVVLAAGMATGVGLSAPASCAAIRCGINNFSETCFIDRRGDQIIASEVPLEQPWRGLTKLAKLAATTIRECLEAAPKLAQGKPVPLVLCLAEEDRPGRLPGLGGPLLFDIERELGLKFHTDSSIVAQGRVGGAVAVLRAQKLIQERQHAQVMLCGVDSYLIGPTLSAYDERNRLLTPANSDGFIPGEGAAAVLIGRVGTADGVVLSCDGLGFSREKATIESDQPLRSDGMVEAMRAALAEAGIGLEQIDHRISDLSGEQYRFKEVALATTRLLRQHKANFGIWHPADSIGEIGAAVLPAMLGMLYGGARKRYLPGPTFLAHLSNDDDKRAAMVLSAQGQS
jgi:3-oxoacyl-[acyl-carrier-protein] synthase I